MSTPAGAEPLREYRGLQRWWVRLPAASARVSRGLAFSLADGHFLAATPRLATLAPPVLAVTGLAIGAMTFGYGRVATEALWIVLVLAAAGFVATGLGTWFIAGLAAGDFLIGQRAWTFTSFGGGILDNGLLAGVLRVRVPMLIGYALLAALAVALPRVARALIADLPKADRLPRDAAFAIAAVVNIVVVAVGVRLWTQAAAVLVRPLFTWQALQPTTSAVSTLQQRGTFVVAAAVLATLVRFGVVWWGYRDEQRANRVLAVEHAVAQGSGAKPWIERPGRLVGAITTALLTTLLVAGVIESWVIAAVLFAVFLTLRLLREGILPLRLDPWRRLVARIPLLLRLAVALLVVDTLRRAFVDEFAATFNQLALYLAVSVVVLYLLLPGAPAQPEPAPVDSGDPAEAPR